MALQLKTLGWAAPLALALGLLLSWRPAAVLALALVALLAWGLATPQRLNYTLLAVLFLVPVTVDPGYHTNPVWVVLFAATGIALLGRVQRFRPDAPLLSAGLAGFVVPAACLIPGVIRWTGPKALLVALLPLLCYAVVTWHLVEEARRDPEVPLRLARATAWVGVPVAGLAVYQWTTGTWPVLDQFATSIAYTSGAGTGRAVGTMGHPIIYGTFCLTGMCVALGLRGRLWQVPFAAGAIGMLLSGTRSAWFGIVAALAVWYLAQHRKITRRGLYLVAGFAAIVAGLATFGPRPVKAALGILTARLSNLTGSASATARYRRIEAAWSGIGDSAVNVLAGRGPEARVRFFQQVGIGDYLAQTFDNSYLTLWYDFGVGALAVLVAVLVVLFVRYGAVTVRMLIIGFVVQIWFFDFYLWPAAAATLILAAALAAAGHTAKHRSTEGPPA